MRDLDTDITIGENTYTLRASLKVLKVINRDHGSLQECYRRVQETDFDAIVGVLAVGAELNKDQRAELEEAAFMHGILALAIPTGRFLLQLMNPSGTEIKPEDADKAGNS